MFRLMAEELSPLQRRIWQAQRIGFAVLVVLVVGGLTGVFGSTGVLAKSRQQSGDGLAVEYPRFARYVAPTTLVVSTQRDAPGRFDLRISRAYIEPFELYSVLPEPTEIQGDHDALIYRFELGAGEQRIVFSGRPHASGRLVGQFGVDGRSPLTLETFVYP
jgi:hypothetical protein